MAGEKNQAASVIYYKNIGNQFSKMRKKRLLGLEIYGKKNFLQTWWTYKLLYMPVLIDHFGSVLEVLS